MQTREELIGGLERALYLMQNIVNLENKRKAVLAKCEKNIPEKEHLEGEKATKMVLVTASIIFVFFSKILMAIIFFIYSLMIKNVNFIANLTWITTGVMCCLIAVGIKKIVNKFIDKKNLEIKQQNDQINQRNAVFREREEVPVLQQIAVVQEQYTEEISRWYPCDYCYIEAAEFFLNAIKNFRADNVKEAINLFENTKHQQRVEQNQKQMVQQQNTMIQQQNVMVQQQNEMIRKQNLSNILAIGGLIMQAGTQSAINNAAYGTQSAINRNTAAVNNMNRTIQNQNYR